MTLRTVERLLVTIQVGKERDFIYYLFDSALLSYTL